LRGSCILLLTCLSVEPIDPGNIRAWNKVPVKVHSYRDRAVPELVAYIRQARPSWSNCDAKVWRRS